MTDFEKWNLYFQKKWCTADMVCQVVELGRLSQEEYETITGDPYPDPEDNVKTKK